MPKSSIEGLQVLEYLRAFLGGRVGWSRLRVLLIVSGAFGLFRKSAVVDAGSYEPDTVGEDAELILRLHLRGYEEGKKARITFFPDPICWTEAPSSWRVLAGQRDRWQRGLIETLWRHRRAMLNPRYGRVGMVGMPYYVLFEMLGPTLETLGLIVIMGGAIAGTVSLPVVGIAAAISVLYGLVLSLSAILLEERAFRRYPSWKCLRRLLALALVENLGYRQAQSLIRTRAWWTLARRSGWGEMTRLGFDTQAPGRPDEVDALPLPAVGPLATS
jgi:cellulose synthase/poly-beta-1,6-N-acetylglucosamine synthase-like glycosyltransferase